MSIKQQIAAQNIRGLAEQILDLDLTDLQAFDRIKEIAEEITWDARAVMDEADEESVYETQRLVEAAQRVGQMRNPVAEARHQIAAGE